MTHNPRVEHAVEALCHRGCRAVWEIIDTLERGGTLPETTGLGSADVSVVVAELRAIMAVYATRCPTPD